MSSRARTSRSQGCTPRLAQPCRPAAAIATNSSFLIAVPLSVNGSIEKRLDRRLGLGLLRIAEAEVGRNDLSVAIDDVRGGHRLYLELASDVSLRIEHHVELNRDIAQEAVGIAPLGIDIDPNDGE